MPSIAERQLLPRGSVLWLRQSGHDRPFRDAPQTAGAIGTLVWIKAAEPSTRLVRSRNECDHFRRSRVGNQGKLMRAVQLIPSMIACSIMAACENAPVRTQAPADNQNAEIGALKQRLSDLESRQVRDDVTRTVQLSADGNGFQTVMTDALFPVTFSLEGVEAYADGTRIKLQIGNPNQANIHDLKASIEYGPPEKRQVQRFSATGVIERGSWHNDTVVLGRVKPDQIGKIDISGVTIGSIDLFKDGA